MILADDVRYHLPPDIKYDWAETSFFSVYLPESNITAWIYLVARTGIGAMVCDVEAIDRIGRISLDALYMDFQQHLPLPERFDRFSLPNGLTFATSNAPRDYKIDYVGVGDTEFHWTVKGLMEPYDIHDPTMDPLASPGATDSGFGSAYANHFDMTARVTGTMRIRGNSYDVDCVTTMDHSWGPRNERGMKSMGWVNGNFDPENAFQTIWSFDPEALGWDQFKLAHGYMLINGMVRGLVGGRMRSSRRGPYPFGYQAVVQDTEGREYNLTGHTVAQHPWACYSNSLAMFSTVRWVLDTREGYGLAQENWPLDSLTGKHLG